MAVNESLSLHVNLNERKEDGWGLELRNRSTGKLSLKSFLNNGHCTGSTDVTWVLRSGYQVRPQTLSSSFSTTVFVCSENEKWKLEKCNYTK